MSSRDPLEEFRRALAEREFKSFAEVQALADSITTRGNRTSLDDFHGLSPEQMDCLLYRPFDSPHLVTFVECIAPAPSAPILTLFMLLAEACGERGQRCTATGNLPPAFCREAVAVFEKAGHKREAGFGVHREPDFDELSTMRIVATLAGLIRKHKGRLILSRDCRKLLATSGAGGVYAVLLRAFARRYNWQYADGYPALPLVQQSFLFTLYLLQRHGATERSQSFYEDAFLRAFPALVDQVEPRPYSTPEQQMRHCYTIRTLVRFAVVAGLAGLRRELIPGGGIDYQFVRTPLLEQAVRFHL